jgi:hypothetical protein
MFYEPRTTGVDRFTRQHEDETLGVAAPEGSKIRRAELQLGAVPHVSTSCCMHVVHCMAVVRTKLFYRMHLSFIDMVLDTTDSTISMGKVYATSGVALRYLPLVPSYWGQHTRYPYPCFD